MKQLAIDTNIAIDFLNDVIGIREKLQEFEEVYLPITVCGELMFGAKNSARQAQNEKIPSLFEYR